MVSNFWVEREGVWGWEFEWRRWRFAWEEDLLRDLREVLPTLVLTGMDDEWLWSLEDGGKFTVRSMYVFLESVFSPVSVFGDQELRVFSNIWKSSAPSKVIAFSWKLLRNRVPVLTNLVYRGIQVNGGSLACVHCQGREESVANLFLFCAAPNKKVRKGFALIWHVTVWMIWRSRNNIIFSRGSKDLVKVIDDIKLLSWCLH
ncbi:F-box family protein [Trifolium medium]|uniref:F-box family protein n=1 Tax=Trifolium medium TaxID=97028 RepID=A0A392MFR2_9FABA|nr:F-box family protein [Trifolium medium]